MTTPFNKTMPGLKGEPPKGRLAEGKTYVGIVKNNIDVQRMGRLEVWIPEMGGSADDKRKWIICSYASPFAGATSVFNNVEDGNTLEDTQTSYGQWFVPPDLENQVLVTFVGGEMTRAFWFACVWQQNMNHMVPGIASDVSPQPGGKGVLPPTAEYNKKTSDPAFNPVTPSRPRYDPLHEGLTVQGLYTDFERGPASTSARRESPSRVFGTLTPRGHTIHFDEDTTNEFIRMRTRGGTQILVHETNGYVYINSKKGNSWIEVSDTGVDIYSRGSISMRTEQDFNVRADRNINLDAGGNVNVKSGASTKINSGTDTHIKANTNMFVEATGIQHQRANAIRQSAQTIDQLGRNINRDGLIFDNNGRATASEFASTPSTVSQTDVDSKSVVTPVSRMPTHEPWSGHPKSSVTTPPLGDTSGSDKVIIGDGTLANPKGNGATPTNVNQTVDQTTGDGSTKKVSIDRSTVPTVTVGTKKVPADVLAAIKKAVSVTGIDFGFMMAMAEQESSFNPNAKAPTSSASGLYQFLDGTWASMVNKYGKQTGITIGQKNEAEASAIMAGYFAKENENIIERKTGTQADATDLYLGHFLGGSGAAKFLSADKNADATVVMGAKVAAANRYVFQNSDGTNRTCQQVRDFFVKKIGAKAAAYSAANL